MPEDRFVYALVPHMHLRGKAFRFTAVYPDNRKEILLDVPRYDFNWQNIYRLAEPKLLPDGTRLVVRGRFRQLGEQLAQSRSHEFGPLG